MAGGSMGPLTKGPLTRAHKWPKMLHKENDHNMV